MWTFTKFRWTRLKVFSTKMGKGKQTTHVDFARQLAAQMCRKWRHWLLPIGIYRGSKNGRKCRIRRLYLTVSTVQCGIRPNALMQCQRRLQITRVKNIGNILEQSGVAFRLAPPYGGLLVELFSWLQKKRFRPSVHPFGPHIMTITTLEAIALSNGKRCWLLIR